MTVRSAPSLRAVRPVAALLPFAFTLGDRNVTIDRQFAESLDVTAALRPFYFDPIDLLPAADTQYHARIVRREITAATNLRSAASQVTGLIDNLRSDGINVRLPADQTQAHPVVLPADVVPNQQRRRIVYRHEDVHRAVIVEIANCQPTCSELLREYGTALRAHILPGTAYIAKQQHRLKVLHIFHSLLNHRIGIAIADDEIEITVIVIIEKLQSPAAEQPRRVRNVRSGSNIVEGRIVAIAIKREHLMIDIGYEEVEPAVLIEIGCIYAHSRPC